MKNVILLTLDTLRQDVLGCYGSKDGPRPCGRGGAGLTPFIDSLQDKCIIFNRCRAIGPYTQASFPGILASSYYLEFGRDKQLSPQRTLISEVVKNGGFTTAGFHSNPYLSDYFGWNRGWDEFYDSMADEVSDLVPYILGDKINSKVADWLASYTRQAGAKPFFLWVHYMDVHEPYVPEQKYVDMVDSSIKLANDEMFALFKDVVLKRDVSNVETVNLLRKLYQAHILQVDDYTREFFGILKKLGVLENSVVIITSDHGDEFGEHGGLSHDGKMYSELINVPLLIYDPPAFLRKQEGGEKGQVCDTLVSSVDIPPTIARLFGLESPKGYHGQSLLPLDSYTAKGCFGEAIGKLSHKVKETDKPVYFYEEGYLRISWRVENDVWEMYDLKEDTKEQNNIIDTSAAAEDMKSKLKSNIRQP